MKTQILEVRQRSWADERKILAEKIILINDLQAKISKLRALAVVDDIHVHELTDSEISETGKVTMSCPATPSRKNELQSKCILLHEISDELPEFEFSETSSVRCPTTPVSVAFLERSKTIADSISRLQLETVSLQKLSDNLYNGANRISGENPGSSKNDSAGAEKSLTVDCNHGSGTPTQFIASPVQVLIIVKSPRSQKLQGLASPRLASPRLASPRLA